MSCMMPLPVTPLPTKRLLELYSPNPTNLLGLKSRMPEQPIVKAMAHVVQKRKGTSYKPKDTPECE